MMLLLSYQFAVKLMPKHFICHCEARLMLSQRGNPLESTLIYNGASARSPRHLTCTSIGLLFQKETSDNKVPRNDKIIQLQSITFVKNKVTYLPRVTTSTAPRLFLYNTTTPLTAFLLSRVVDTHRYSSKSA